MLFFELYRQLDIRMFQTMSAIDPKYGSVAKYVFDGDSLVLLGSDHSVRLDILTKKISNDNPIKNWDIENEAMMWFAEDSVEAAVVRVINDAYRMWMQLDNNITVDVFSTELMAINEILASYDLKIFADKTGMSVFKDGNAFTFEQAIEYIMDVDENRMDDEGIDNLINEAFFYRNMDKYEEAATRLEKVVRYVDHTLPIYTSAMFTLAQTYYYMGNYDRAVMLYYRVDAQQFENQDYFFSHLGHALLDNRMKKYERNLRVYFHAQIDAEYADTHRQAVAAARGAVEEVFAEYDATCLEMGRKKYEEYRKSLPENADDIDELLEVYETEEEKVRDNRHRQLEGIILREPVVEQIEADTDVNGMLSSALEMLKSGEYQKAFDAYFLLKARVDENSDYYTWICFQLGKLYCMFDMPDKAVDMFEECDPNRFGVVYRLEDYLLLRRHAHIVRDDFESDGRYRRFVRAKVDSYFAQYDREYNLMLRDKKLIKAYAQYEKSCIEDSKYELKDVLTDLKSAGGGFLFKLFGRKNK